ncbi:MAG: N-6 DNA methylase [Candidatus Hadarchaeum sp.]|uniref:type I restriction-modification system subunit M n=1 Tax=Candidatus Hadarchaeum sp. TaxID=2883567 RepID=UPI003178BE03
MERRELAGKVERICEIMRADGLYLLQYIEQLSWLVFLKIFEDMEEEFRLEAELEGKPYHSIIDPKYSWSNWARKDMRAEDLEKFIGQELLPYYRSLRGTKQKEMIASIFAEVRQHMRSPYALKEVISMIDGIDFTNPEDSHALSQIYEELLMLMGKEGGAAGEYYTPRPIVRLMVKIVDPKIGETVFDPLCGSCGFLAEAFEHMKRKRSLTAEEERVLEESTFFGQELKFQPYLIGIMNCILHGIFYPNVRRVDTFEENVATTPAKRYSVILTNPPFGGKIEKRLRGNLPVETGSTELAALQFCMRKLEKDGRCGIVIPEGILFRGGAYARVKKELLENFNVHTIISLPAGVFAYISPKGGTGPKANLLFFDRTGPTKEIWYYELQGEYTKAKPIKDEDLVDCFEKWKDRKTSENSWIVPVEEIVENGYDMSAKNPSRKKEVGYLEPEKIVAGILEKEKEILKILGEFQEILADKND